VCYEAMGVCHMPLILENDIPLLMNPLHGLIHMRVSIFNFHCDLQPIPLTGVFEKNMPVKIFLEKKNSKVRYVRAMVTPNRQSHIVALPNGNTERHGIWRVLSLVERSISRGI
jgi:hypothetical protein